MHYLGKPDLVITDCQTQKDMKWLAGARSICLDAYGTDSAGKKYDMEIQRADKGADRTRYLKGNPKGVSEMCKVIEDMWKEEREEDMREGMKAAALRMLEAGKYPHEEIAAISGLSLEEIRKLHTEQGA